MVVTEVKVKLVPKSDDKLLAFASITFDKCFVVRDIKVIQGSKTLFIAMPSRKITDRCMKCGAKNHLQAQFCNQCGIRLSHGRSRPDDRGRVKLHADIAHPINVKCRHEIQEVVLRGYAQELERSRQPGYQPVSFEEEDAGPEFDGPIATPAAGTPAVATPPRGMPAVRDGAQPHPAAPTPPQPQAREKPKDKPAPDGKRNDAGGFGVFG